MPRYIDIDLLKRMVEARADMLIEGKQAFDYIAKWLDKLTAADIEILPCRIGDKVWCVTTRYGHWLAREGTVIEIYYKGKDMVPCVITMEGRGAWGVKVFATKEEAERALKGSAE